MIIKEKEIAGFYKDGALYCRECYEALPDDEKPELCYENILTWDEIKEEGGPYSCVCHGGLIK